MIYSCLFEKVTSTNACILSFEEAEYTDRLEVSIRRLSRDILLKPNGNNAGSVLLSTDTLVS